MPQSLARVIVHLIYSTRDRTPWIANGIREEAHAYLVGALKGEGCIPLQVGGVEDHVHLLFGLSRTSAIAQVVENVKKSSSKWIKDKPGCTNFAWQARYAVYSVGAGEVDAAVRYVQNQERHHQSVGYQDEVRKLLTDAGVVYDERYVWQ